MLTILILDRTTELFRKRYNNTSTNTQRMKTLVWIINKSIGDTKQMQFGYPQVTKL